MFQYTPQEEAYYRRLWAPFDPQGQGFSEAKGTVQFFKKSGLPVDTLKGIWIASVKNQEGKLYYQEFFIIMRLIAYCQNGFEFNEQLLNENRSVPLPVMEGIQSYNHNSNSSITFIVIFKQLNQEQSNLLQQAQNLVPQSNYFQTQPVESSVQISLQSYVEPKLQEQLINFIIDLSQYDLPDNQYQKYELCFTQQDKAHQGFIQGEQARAFFQRSQLPASTLNRLWILVDIGQKGFLFKNEFIVAVHLIALCRKDIPLPQPLPESLLQLTKRDQQQSQTRSTSQTMPQMTSSLPPQPQRAGSQNELQGQNNQTSYLQNKPQNQSQQIQIANNSDQQKQIIEDKKKDVEFLNQTIQKLQSCYDFLKKEQDELQTQIHYNKQKFQFNLYIEQNIKDQNQLQIQY